MKGIIFAEFLDMVEQTYGIATVDKILVAEQLPSGGAYTAVGTYDFAEMVQLISNLSQQTQIEESALLKSFGKYFFNCLRKTYPHFFTQQTGAFDFLKSVQNHIYVEVKKLYRDAELPSFEFHNDSPEQLEMVYHSKRKLSDFAEGLIEETLKHFKEPAIILKENIKSDGSVVSFFIQKIDAP